MARAYTANPVLALVVLAALGASPLSAQTAPPAEPEAAPADAATEAPVEGAAQGLEADSTSSTEESDTPPEAPAEAEPPAVPAEGEPGAAAPPPSEEPTADDTASEESLDLTSDDDLLTDSSEGEDDDFLDLNVTQSDEPSVLERQIVAIVASGVTVAAIAAGAVFGALAYVQYQCVSDVLQCNEGLMEPIVGDQLFEARANVEHLSLLADMAYLFAAASALVAITGFVRGFIFTGEDSDDDADGGDATLDDSALDGDDVMDDGVIDDGTAEPAADPIPSSAAVPAGDSGGSAATPASPPSSAMRRSARSGSLYFEVE